VVSGTALITLASLVYPGILLALQRSPAALGGQVWRFLTPLFVERGGWKEIAFNLVALVATWRIQGPYGEMTISFRYELQDGGRRLRAAEQFRGAGRDQDNVWVFERA
jgi:hypothetical protein